jgi:Rieske Fe-S protein
VPNEQAEANDRGFAERGHFRCPCHASLYNRYGQIIAGPATRPMDRFPLRIQDGAVYVETGPQRAIRRAVAGADDITPA